eukprot:3545545-Alexandrium_andersonii.AAC.1
MSASLVGSEMCIRDRKGNYIAGLPATASNAHRLQTQLPKIIAHKQNSAAVSYTHLTLPTICSV